MNYDELLPVAVQAVEIAHDLFLTRSPGELTAKGDRDMASEVDYAIERQLAEFLREKTPHIGFYGEEDGSRGLPRDLTWTLDPVDGTVNFVHGSPLCGISLALIDDHAPVLGVIDLPFLNSRYTATQGTGAFCGQRRIEASSTAVLTDAVVAIGDYAVGPEASRKNAVRLAVTARLAATAQRVRMHGSAALDLVWLAEGRIDGVVIMSNQPWDTAAGVVIAKEAGAVIVDRDGAAHDSRSSATIAANAELLPELLNLISAATRDPLP